VTIRGASGKVYEEMDVTKLQMSGASGVGGKRLEVGVDKTTQGVGKDLMISMLETEVKYKEKTINHFLDLIRTYGFCRPEMQLARMELEEANGKWAQDKNVDDKNLGAIAKFVVAEMIKKGEL
jgi:hypothetical protein